MQTNRQSGFTIVEMVVSLGIMGIVIVVLTQLYFGGHRLYQTQNAELSINYSARRVLDDVDEYVRQATQVASTYGAYGTSPTVLILEVQSVDDTNALIPGTFDTIIFYKTGTQVFREIAPSVGSVRTAGTVLLADDVLIFGFGFDAWNFSEARQITTNITFLQSTGRENQSLVVSSTSTLRN